MSLIAPWFLRLTGALAPNEKLVCVKSWRPWWGPFGIEWPCMLIDRGAARLTVSPVWDRARLWPQEPDPMPEEPPSTATIGGPAGNLPGKGIQQ